MRRHPSSALTRVAIATLVATGGFATRAAAQASLSLQGFGFPTGQLSSRALGTGGSIGEIDPLSPINPASVSLLTSRIVYFQAEPEFRTISSPSGDDHTRTDRYPNVFGAIPIMGGAVLSLGSSTLLDRTSTTVFTAPQLLTPIDSVLMTTKFNIQGAMNDVRLAVGWSPTAWFRFGVGLHGIAGHNLVTVQQSFSDTVAFALSQEQRILSFSGTAASVGAQFLAKDVTFAVSARQGGSLTMSAGDTTLTPRASAESVRRFRHLHRHRELLSFRCGRRTTIGPPSVASAARTCEASTAGTRVSVRTWPGRRSRRDRCSSAPGCATARSRSRPVRTRSRRRASTPASGRCSRTAAC